VIIVAARCEAGVNRLRRAVRDEYFPDAAFTVEQQPLAVARPVRRFDVITRVIDNAPILRRDGNEFERALHIGGRTG